MLFITLKTTAGTVRTPNGNITTTIGSISGNSITPDLTITATLITTGGAITPTSGNISSNSGHTQTRTGSI